MTSAAQAVTVEFDVPAQMRDGVTLRANVHRPEGAGPWPTLLMRTPYGKSETLSWINLAETARKGFMVVVQDTRGRFASDGEWAPLRHERQDGYDTVEWAARLPGSNGRVGMLGTSYVGNTQWMAAIEQPPSLAAIAPGVTWADPLDGLFARGGALELGLAMPWTVLMSSGQLGRSGLDEDERARRLEAALDDLDRLAGDGYRSLPVEQSEILRRCGEPDVGTFAMLSNPEVPDWCRVSGRHEHVTVPSFNVGGWYDALLQGTLDNYMAMAALGRPARLVVGPWMHADPCDDPVGERCFGLRARRAGVPVHPLGDLNDVQLAWFRRHLLPDAEQAPDEDAEAPVRIFVMGRNAWRDEQEWPPARARVQRWLLGARGTLTADGAAVRASAGPSEFTYDPADPVPTLGGHTVMSPAHPAGAFDQARVEARRDVLVYTSDPLQRELEVTGRVRVVLHAASSASSTDWVARLCDVHPDGRSYNVCDGIVRIAERADQLQRVEIDLWSTSNAFLPGHRLRVHVTSSSFPRWDRNLNTGNQRDARFETARQQLFHDADRASWIELPVVA